MTADQAKLTAEGTIIGTFQYMAPEQLEGKEADARTDVFGLGEVIYEMATGKPAFSGKSRASLIAAILTTEPPPISQLQPLTPPALERVVKKCLAKDPDDRWQLARDIETNLTWIAEGESPATASAVRHNPWLERTAWMLVSVFLSALAFFGAGHYRAPSTGNAARFSVNPPEKAVFSGAPNITVQVPQFALSPDGRAIVFVANSPGADPILWLRSMEQVAAHPLSGTERAQLPFWSPDSRWIGFFAEGKLKKIPVAGGPAQVLADVVVLRRGIYNRSGAGHAGVDGDGTDRHLSLSSKETQHVIDSAVPSPRNLRENVPNRTVFWCHFGAKNKATVLFLLLICLNTRAGIESVSHDITKVHRASKVEPAGGR